ncbi:Symplekin tight junction protein C terminal-domain-containing protein [Epithele typhae]|uniref:Symplekin tight junction protein C terminal-domain-containing protein n=1 Tax=Epithele typhae TaxID=378194 RepID=UPI0020075CE1|nr:Symplekin tight junction protein C terminal-domain-containing protein [Epithele typhae]KAH9935928.1 Symplekin tight junction protein C terminal-domain-containing protein [Epithele typhae]
MAAAVDPLAQMSAVLAAWRASLENHPGLGMVCTTFALNVLPGPDSLVKRWALDLLLEALAAQLNDPNVSMVKVAVQCFATVYVLLFRSCCMNPSNRKPWDIIMNVKARILEMVWAPHINQGLRISAVKFMQKVVLVQTRGVNDPRVRPKLLCGCSYDSMLVLLHEGIKLLQHVITTLYTSSDPDMITSILNSWSTLVKKRPALVELVVHTLIQWGPGKLEGQSASAVRSVEKGVRIFLTHILRSPQGQPFQNKIQVALSAQSSRMEQAAAAEKARKAALAEASRKRSPSGTPAAATPEPKRPKLEHDVALTSLVGFDYTSLPANLVTELIVANLQAYTENALIGLVQSYRHTKHLGSIPGLSSTPPPAGPSRGPEQATATPPPMGSRMPPSEPRADRDRKVKSATPPPLASVVVKQEEPVDPLKMDIDDEEMEYEPDKLNLEMAGDDEPVDEAEAALDHDMDEAELPLTDFKLPPAMELDADDREVLMTKAIKRIREGAGELFTHDMEPADASKTSPADMWMLILVRMVTRVSQPPSMDMQEDEDAKEEEGVVANRSELQERQERLRHRLVEYITADFPGRVRLATAWMNEEWYNDRIRRLQDRDWQPNYDTWLNQIVAAYQTHADHKDRTFSRFLLDLPQVPQDVLNLLRESCVEAERRQMGFAALREFVSQRPSLRAEAMTMLLELTTHPDKITRGAAINTVKRWIPDAQPMSDMIRDFALQLLRRLQSRPKSLVDGSEAEGEAKDHKDDNEDEDVIEDREVEEVKQVKEVTDVEDDKTPQANGTDENMEDGQLPQEDIIQTPYLPKQLELPAVDAQILQHVELLFALSTKVPEFLEEIFAAYGGMEQSVQETIQTLITPLVRALGPSHGKLLTILRTFPRGAESLALRVLNIFTESGRPSAQLVALVKSLVNERENRELDARFLIPIIAEMDKADIMRYLPRIVSILNSTPEAKNLVRSVFSSVVATPPETFGKITSNLPRVRQSELLTPAELMVLLHESERETGLRSAIEAITICFSMTDIFRFEILAAVMNQLVDEPNLPTLFLRTVIQAVGTYRSLRAFVSTTLFSRLITKKIWTNPPLWEGFIRCAKLLAPQSFGALLQLPKEQLREVVEKQPSLKSELREFVMKKGTNKARVAGFLDIFGDDDAAAPGANANGSAAAEKAQCIAGALGMEE